MKQQMRALAYHLKPAEVKKLIQVQGIFSRMESKFPWPRVLYKATMDMYGTISIDEMQEITLRNPGE